MSGVVPLAKATCDGRAKLEEIVASVGAGREAHQRQVRDAEVRLERQLDNLDSLLQARPVVMTGVLACRPLL